MAKMPVEIGQSFYKTDSHWIVWLTRVDDPTTYITVSINVLSDPRYFRRSDL